MQPLYIWILNHLLFCMLVMLPESQIFLKDRRLGRSNSVATAPTSATSRCWVLSPNVGWVEMARKLPEETRASMIGQHIGCTKFLLRINKEYAHDYKPWVNKAWSVLCSLLSLQHFHFKSGLHSSICPSNRVLHHRQSWPMYNAEQK